MTASIYGRHGLCLRLLYMGVAVGWYLFVRPLYGTGGRAIVLCYHGVKPHQAQRFMWQIRCIASRVIAARGLDIAGDDGIRSPLICLTFDDGFANLLDHALPILRELGVPATVFGVASNLGARPRWSMPAFHPDAGEVLMTAEQIRAATSGGLCEFGSHTLTHADLTTLSLELLRQELCDSKRELETLLGNKVEDLALPYGVYDEQVIAAAVEAGYKRVFTLDPRPTATSSEDAVVGRFSMSPDVWRIEFILTCAGAYAWLEPWRRFVRCVRGVLSPRSKRRLAPA